MRLGEAHLEIGRVDVIPRQLNGAVDWRVIAGAVVHLEDLRAHGEPHVLTVNREGAEFLDLFRRDNRPAERSLDDLQTTQREVARVDPRAAARDVAGGERLEPDDI